MPAEMKHNIIPALVPLATPIDKVRVLKNNPWEGDVEAMRVSLRTLGQHRPIVANGNPEDGGEATVGNHMLKAARLEGWSHVAVAWTDEDEDTRRARAVVDNRMQSLGHPVDEFVAEFVESAYDTFFEVFEVVGYDDFTIAEMEESSVKESAREKGYVAPELVPRTNQEFDVTDDEDVSRETVDEDDDEPVVPSREKKEERKPVVQYLLVFDDAEQQKRWYDFVRFLRSQPGKDGTTAALLLDFLNGVAEF